MPPLVHLENITKVYGAGDEALHVLRGITLDIAEGEFVALMGPSGSGKSTLMHILGFLDRPTSGAYLFDGKEMSALTDDERSGMRASQVAFVFQAFHLLPRLTAWENVALPLMYANVPAAQRKIRACAALADVGLGERVDFFPAQLSGGQKQRVAIARALITQPRVLFADEPTGNLDSASAQQVFALLRTIHASGRTIVMVTHEPDAAAVAQRVIRFRDGEILLSSYARP